MKKFFYSLFAMATMLLGTTSCSSEDELVPSGSNEGVAVTFQLSMEGAVPSRAADHSTDNDLYATGKTVNNVIAAVYSNGVEITELRQPENTINPDLTCNVTFRLIEGQTYDFVFWAEKNGTGYYNTEDLTAIKVNYKDLEGNAYKANDEARDAFTATEKVTIKGGGMNVPITLKRPFAQLNIASLDEDHRIAELTGFGCDELSSKVVITNLPNTYNALTKAVSGESGKVVFDLAKVPAAAGEVLKNVKEYDYIGYLSMNYFLASEAGDNIEMTACFKSSKSEVPVEIKVPNVPVQRNYRTNIIGNILTEQTVFNIVIDPAFDGDHNYPETGNQALEYAAANGGEVTLTEDVTLTKSLIVAEGKRMVINLNGHDIINNSTSEELGVGDGIIVYGDLEINGKGTVQGYTRSVWARGNTGAKVTINGGDYIGCSEEAANSEVIYASGNGQVEIYGGTFEANYISVDVGSQYALLNLHDGSRETAGIKVYGGTFKSFNPADNKSEGAGTNFVAEGYKVVSEEENYIVLPEISASLKGVTESTIVELEEDVYVRSGQPIQTQDATADITINGNGKTIISQATSADDFQWNETGNIAYMSTILSSEKDSEAKVTVNDLSFTGTMSALSLGHYVNSSSNWYNTELNNVNVIGAEVVSFSANISPAVCIYGTATLNNCNIYGTTLSPLDTDPMWPVYDVAAVNYSKTNLNYCNIGTCYIWNQAELHVNEGTEIDVIVVRGNMNTTKYGVTIKAGAKVGAIDLSAITDKAKINITIEEGATVGKFVANGAEYASLEEWQNAE